MRARSLCGVVVLTCVLPAAAAAQRPGELIERTLAIAGGQVVTLSDVRTAAALGLVDGDAAEAAAIASALVDRLLILREVQRYAAIEPADRAVDERYAEIAARAGGPAPLAAVLEAGGFNEPALRAWIRDDLRIAAYLEQRFPAAIAPPPAGTADRDQLAAERRQALITDWVADLRRRTPIVELYRK